MIAALPGADFPTTFAQVQTNPPKPADPGGQGEDFGKSSPLGFLILVLFFVAVAFLVRSMTKHLKRLPESFDNPTDEPAEGADPPAKPAAG
ncbi:hypothetical protein [Actinokineospora terrae]|uniref:Uncharacterized protein n=1 Tax=Actinokineospora terrae TaxID=155974 RepID=A0A1H9URD2_9PSEU|nr:hypothetical protein [Actinokineospora terrae]SES12055.1 hypothetical protein SAMN04487818_107432 [Actinokineospora terrae]